MLALLVLGEEPTAPVDTRTAGCKIERRLSTGLQSFTFANVPFPTLLKCIAMNIDNHVAIWKVIALINGAIEAVSGPAAQDRPGAHEWMVWQGPAACQGFDP